jgi:hypothetical protein
MTRSPAATRRMASMRSKRSMSLTTTPCVLTPDRSQSGFGRFLQSSLLDVVSSDLVSAMPSRQGRGGINP